MKLKYSNPNLKLALLPAAMLLGFSLAHAQDSLQACSDISNDAERLRCYDEATRGSGKQDLPVARLPGSSEPTAMPVPRVEQLAPSAQQPAVVANDNGRPAAPAAAGDDFGLQLKQGTAAAARERTYTVLAVRHNDFAGWTIEFAEGGTWRQVGTDAYDIEVGETYMIRRGTLNSYMLGNADNNRKIRVTRIR